MNFKFTAIDFETANGYRNSICQIGLAVFEDGVLTQQISRLVRPPDNFYWDRFVELHGITPEATESEPTFEKVWNDIKDLIVGQHVVAHNGMGFDFPVLKETLKHYRLPSPDFIAHDTYKLYKKNLFDLCRLHHIHLNHHDALSDAEACGQLFLKFLQSPNGDTYLKKMTTPSNLSSLPKALKTHHLIKSIKRR
jgi:DNA polymerase-3 subunit epsilon